MAKINVKGLVIKRNGNCYWQPNKSEREAGWQSLPLGKDVRAAQAACDRQNAKVEEWRAGGSKPRQVKAFVRRGTVRQLIARYRAEKFGTGPGKLGQHTQRTYNTSLNIIERWAGEELVEHITRARVKIFVRALLKPSADGTIHLTRANSTLRVLHTLMQFAIDEQFLPENTPNPAARHDMPGAPPRDQIWSQPAIELFCKAALEGPLDQPSMALAVHLAREVTQREADIIGLTIGKWVEIPPYKLHDNDWEHLAEPEPDGRLTVRGIRIRQRKTRRWIEVPVVGETRRMMEQAVERARAQDSTLVLQELAIPADQARDWMQFERQIEDELRAAGVKPSPEMIRRIHAERRVPRQWGETRFQREVARLRDRAAELAVKQGDDELAEEIRGLQFRDFRRTGVVWLGELGIEDSLIGSITGHKLDEVRAILETYMPRTTKMAGRAVVQRLERDPEGKANMPGKAKEKG